MLHERSCSSHSLFKQLLGKSITDRFCHYLEQFTWKLHFWRIVADERLCTGRFMKRAAYCSFRGALQSNYFGKVSLITFVYASNKMLKHCIFNDSLLIVNYMQGVLIAPFAEPLKCCFWKILLIIVPVLRTINLHFCHVFCR